MNDKFNMPKFHLKRNASCETFYATLMDPAKYPAWEPMVTQHFHLNLANRDIQRELLRDTRSGTVSRNNRKS